MLTFCIDGFHLHDVKCPGTCFCLKNETRLSPVAWWLKCQFYLMRNISFGMFSRFVFNNSKCRDYIFQFQSSNFLEKPVTMEAFLLPTWRSSHWRTRLRPSTLEQTTCLKPRLFVRPLKFQSRKSCFPPKSTLTEKRLTRLPVSILSVLSIRGTTKKTKTNLLKMTKRTELKIK